jgi:hypothetical protein
LFIGLGDYYIDEVINLLKMIRKVGDTLPISIICLEKDVENLKSKNIFDKIIPINFNDSLFQTALTDFEKFGAIPKILMLNMTPYEETIFTDSDMLCQYNTTHVWDILSNTTQCINLVGQNFSPEWHFGYNWKVSHFIGKEVPETHSGIVYWNKSHHQFDRFYYNLIDIWNRYDYYQMLRWFRGGRPDEAIFAVALANMDYKVLEFSETPVITFNYDENVVFPCNIQTIPNIVELDKPIPFIHMFKPHRNAYLKLVDRLLN